jgi:hypothetical protein
MQRITDAGSAEPEQKKRIHPGMFKPDQSGNPLGGRVKGAALTSYTTS